MWEHLRIRRPRLCLPEEVQNPMCHAKGVPRRWLSAVVDRAGKLMPKVVRVQVVDRSLVHGESFLRDLGARLIKPVQQQ